MVKVPLKIKYQIKHRIGVGRIERLGKSNIVGPEFHVKSRTYNGTIYQDKKSTIQLINRSQSNSEKTRHLNIRFFFLTDRIKTNEIKIEYESTKEMLADILLKPLQDEQFRALRNQLLNNQRKFPSV